MRAGMGAFDLLERTQHAVEVFLGDADTGVLDLEPRTVPETDMGRNDDAALGDMARPQ